MHYWSFFASELSQLCENSESACYGHISWSHVLASWLHLGPSRPHLGPSWPPLLAHHVRSWPILSHLGSILTHLGTICLCSCSAISFCSFCPVHLCPTSCPTPPTLCAVISSGAGGPNGFAVRIRLHRPLWLAAWGVSRRYFRHMTVMS